MSKKPHQRKTRGHSPTSKEAHDSIKDCKEVLHNKISEAMLNLPVGGTFEQIAKAANLKKEQVWKRLSEMSEGAKPTIINTHYTRKGESGRKQSVWLHNSFLKKNKSALRKIATELA